MKFTSFSAGTLFSISVVVAGAIVALSGGKLSGEVTSTQQVSLGEPTLFLTSSRSYSSINFEEEIYFEDEEDIDPTLYEFEEPDFFIEYPEDLPDVTVSSSSTSSTPIIIAPTSVSSVSKVTPPVSVSSSSVSVVPLDYTEQDIAFPLFPDTNVPVFPTQLPATYQQQSSVSTVYFSDISNVSPEGHAAYMLAERGILSGYPDGTFRPDIPVNRAEVIKLILNTKFAEIPLPQTVYTATFTDVPRTEWYVPYVAYGVSQGIISGYPDNTFKGGYLVNTAEFLKMATKAFGLREGAGYTYRDVPLQSWYAPYAGVAQSYALFPDRPTGYLDAERFLTRGEVAYALSRILGLQ